MNWLNWTLKDCQEDIKEDIRNIEAVMNRTTSRKRNLWSKYHKINYNEIKTRNH